MADLADVEENGLCWDLLLVVVQGIVKDLQCLQSPMHMIMKLIQEVQTVNCKSSCSQ